MSDLLGLPGTLVALELLAGLCDGWVRDWGPRICYGVCTGLQAGPGRVRYSRGPVGSAHVIPPHVPTAGPHFTD